jgi:hypothetical protein
MMRSPSITELPMATSALPPSPIAQRAKSSGVLFSAITPATLGPYARTAAPSPATAVLFRANNPARFGFTVEVRIPSFWAPLAAIAAPLPATVAKLDGMR